MSTLLTTAPQREEPYQYPGLIPLLAGLFGGIAFICICLLAWCFVRRRKHRAPIIPYSMHTLRSPDTEVQDEENQANTRKPRPAKLGTHGRGVGYGFNPIFKEPYGGGGGLESGKGPIGANRAGVQYG